MKHRLEEWVNFMLQDQEEDKEERVLCHLMMRIDDLDSLLVLESHCPRLSIVMKEQHWWELLFAKWFPITYERLQHTPIAANSKVFLLDMNQQHPSYYRDIWIAQHAWTKCNTFSTADVLEGACVAAALGDEFGIGPLFATTTTTATEPSICIATKNNKDKNALQWRRFPLVVPELHADDISRYRTDDDDAEEDKKKKQFVATAIPLQGKVILRMFKEGQEGYDLVMLNVIHSSIIRQDMSNWAINYPDGDPLNLPPFLDGDPTLEVPSIAATEKNARLSSMQRNGALSVLLDRVWPPPYDLLIFDQLYQSNEEPAGGTATTSRKKRRRRKQHDETWHPLCTARVKVQCVTTSMAYVLDSFLLMASTDGTLWAKPRNNPRSQYFVQQFPGPITYLTSLYNVIAFMCNRNSTLRVCHVKRIPVDPFIALVSVFSSASTPAVCHPLLLFGPYLLYQTSLMESSSDEEHLIAILSKKKPEPQPQEPGRTEKEGREINGNPDDVPPEIYKKGRNWQRNRQKMIIRYGLWDVEKREMRQREEEAKRAADRKALKAKVAAKRGAEFMLVNYETKAQMKVAFPAFQYGWRLHSIKMANHSQWILTLYNCNKLKDIILSTTI